MAESVLERNVDGFKFRGLETVDLEETNNFKRNGLPDPTTAVSHQCWLLCKYTCLVTPAIRCLMTEERLIHSLDKCLRGTHLNKQIWSLIWFMTSASHHCALTPDPLTTMNYLPSHMLSVSPGIVMPLSTLVPLSAWWNTICPEEPSVPSLKPTPWAFSSLSQPVFGTCFHHGVYYILLPVFVCVSLLLGFVFFKRKFCVIFKWSIAHIKFCTHITYIHIVWSAYNSNTFYMYTPI